MVKTPTQTAHPDRLPPSPEAEYKLPELEPRYRAWQRLIIGGASIALGLVAVGVGLASVSYRLTHMTVEGGLVNGRTVRLQAPVDGTIQDFYARPGASVQAGQVLARLEPLLQSQEGSTVPQLQQDVQTHAVELASARQTLNLLDQQLRDIESQDQVLQTANVAIASDQVSHNRAALDAAIAKEEAARADYERYRYLLAEGAVSQQQVDQLEATWKSAQAAVRQAQAEQNSAQMTLNALDQGAPISGTEDLQARRHQLIQEIQAQTTHVKTLEVALNSQQEQLQQLQARYGEDPQLEITAPFAGVVYTTEHDAGEQVNRPATLLSLLDCNDLWVETLVSTEQAHRLDTEKPVRVQFSGSSGTLVGQVDLVEAISTGDLTKMRAEALVPAVPPSLLGQPLARVRVRIPPTFQQTQTYQFCGVGQSARLTFGTKILAGNSRFLPSTLSRIQE